MNTYYCIYVSGNSKGKIINCLIKEQNYPLQSNSVMLFKRTGIHPGNNIGTHSIMAHLDHSSSLPRGLCLCPRPLEATLCTAATETLIQPWVLSHCSCDQSLSDSPSLSESNSDSYKVLQSWSGPAPMASLPHLLPLPPLHPLSSSHPGLGCCSNTPGTFFCSLCSTPPYHRGFHWPVYRRSTASFTPITLYLQDTCHDLVYYFHLLNCLSSS